MEGNRSAFHLHVIKAERDSSCHGEDRVDHLVDVSARSMLLTQLLSVLQVYQGGETTDGRRIYVGNINYDYREDEIRNAFNEVRSEDQPLILHLLKVCLA